MMKFLFFIVLSVYSGLSMASGQPVACAFDAVFNQKLENVSKDIYRIKITPLKRIAFTHKSDLDTDWMCLAIGKKYSGIIYLSKINALKLGRQKIGDTVRLVRFNSGGELPPEGESAEMSRLVLWDAAEYTVSVPLNTDAVEGMQ